LCARSPRGARGGLGAPGVFLERAGRGLGCGIGHLERLQIPLSGKLAGLGKADGGIFRRKPGHGYGTPGHLAHCFGRCIGGRNAGLAPADQNPEADIRAFRTLGMLKRPSAEVSCSRS